MQGKGCESKITVFFSIVFHYLDIVTMDNLSKICRGKLFEE